MALSFFFMRLILLVCFLRSVNKRVPTVLDISGNFKSGISRLRKSNVNGHGNLCSQFFFFKLCSSIALAKNECYLYISRKIKSLKLQMIGEVMGKIM